MDPKADGKPVVNLTGGCNDHKKVLLVGRDGELEGRPVAPRVLQVETYGYAGSRLRQ